MCSLSKEMTPPTVSVDTIRSKISDNSLRLIDVRREEEYNQGHIPNAVNLPLANLLSDNSPESAVKLFEEMGIEDNTEVVVYDDTFGALASRIAWTLQYIGHKNVALLEITYSQWKELGLKINKEKPNIKPTKHSLNLNSDIMATAEYLENAKEKENVVLIDNRERLNYLEHHIPGSINIPYRTLATDGKILRTKESMRNLLKNRGISEDAEIITYCGSVGTLSGLAYYALKSIGIPNVKLYVNSFKEWKKLEKPIDKQENAAYWDLSAD